jgi:hypothetical protein
MINIIIKLMQKKIFLKRNISNKMILFCFLFLTQTYSIYSQTYNNPNIFIRTNKSATISSITVLDNTIIVEIEYLGSSRQTTGYINILPETKIKTKDGLAANLLSTKNIEIAPKKTSYKPNVLQKFTLVFEKIANLDKKEFSIVESTKSPWSLNFFGIELKDNRVQTENNSVKNDYFLSQIPDALHHLFYWDYFIESSYNTKVDFDNLIEYAIDEKIPQIEKIDGEEYDSETYAYTLSTNLPTTNVSSYYYSNKEDGKSINHITFYFKNEADAQLYFKSFCDWYGASINVEKKLAVKSYFKNKNIYDIFIKINQRYEIFYTVDITVKNNM